jgi:hypothetical protein
MGILDANRDIMANESVVRSSGNPGAVAATLRNRGSG